MTSAIVLPSLTNWTQQHLQSIIKATKQADFDAAYNNFLSQDAKITVNGVSVTRDQYKQYLKQESFLEASATINFDGAVEVPQNKAAPIEVWS